MRKKHKEDDITYERTIKDMVKKIISKTRFERLKEDAQNGDVLSMYALGDIFFYGINTSDGYMECLAQTIALTRRNAKLAKDEYNTSKKDLKNYGIIAECTNEPDYQKALKWYRLALENGYKKAEEKIKIIEQDKIEGLERKQQVTQVFLYDFDSR